MSHMFAGELYSIHTRDTFGGLKLNFTNNDLRVFSYQYISDDDNSRNFSSMDGLG